MWYLETTYGKYEMNEELQALKEFDPSQPYLNISDDQYTFLLKLMCEEADDVHCLAYAVIAENEQFTYEQTFGRIGTRILADETEDDMWEDLYEEFLPKYAQGCTILWLSSLEKGCGAGMYLATRIKEAYEGVLLYSVAESTGFWQKQQFESFHQTPIYGFNWTLASHR